MEEVKDLLNKCDNCKLKVCITCEFTYTDIQKIKEYVKELEFQNTALKAEHNHNITRIKELEQKESILDKVTDKLKEDAREEEGYIKWLDERTKEIVQPRKTIVIKSDYARSILNIIEGGNNGK